jgi:hypothetical protein
MSKTLLPNVLQAQSEQRYDGGRIVSELPSGKMQLAESGIGLLLDQNLPLPVTIHRIQAHRMSCGHGMHLSGKGICNKELRPRLIVANVNLQLRHQRLPTLRLKGSSKGHEQEERCRLITLLVLSPNQL